MLDFRLLPKQFLISPRTYLNIQNAKMISFADYNIYTAESVPRVDLTNEQGKQIGLIIGWVIYSGRLIPDGDKIIVSRSISSLYRKLSGRFVFLWQDNTGFYLQLDANGFLPVVFDEEKHLIASSAAVIDSLHSLEVNKEVWDIFEFPKRRGFLPFGLTNYRGLNRLLPNHVLDLKNCQKHRVWPSPDFCSNPLVSQSQIPSVVSDIATILKSHVSAIINGGRGILYLSGGHDSRMILAACRDFKEHMTCETLINPSVPDAHISGEVTCLAGIKHLLIKILPTSKDEVLSWLYRTGYTFYDPLTELAETARVHDRRYHVMDGTGAEITRASNWMQQDINESYFDVETLLKRIRMPDVPIIRNAAIAWIESLPKVDVTTGLDIAKIEQIHGCWAGSGVYGHMILYPSISPFSGLRINELALKLPKAYKFSGKFYNDFLSLLWPDLLEIPTNRVTGLYRLKHLKYELKKIFPKKIKTLIKPLR